jgi:class 3 adenylate cyclase
MIEGMTESRTVRRLLVCFVDLSTFARDAERHDDARVADVLDRYYQTLGTAVAAASGRLVKLIGDGAFLVFPPEKGDDVVRALLRLRDEVATLMSSEGWGSSLVIKLHAGDVVCGAFGPPDHRRFDVIGKEVNIAARLPTRSFAISAEAFRALGKDARKLFKKHTPPITYIPIDDKRPNAFMGMR